MEYSSVAEHLHGACAVPTSNANTTETTTTTKKPNQQQNPPDLKSRVKNANTGLRNMDTDCNIF